MAGEAWGRSTACNHSYHSKELQLSAVRARADHGEHCNVLCDSTLNKSTVSLTGKGVFLHTFSVST